MVRNIAKVLSFYYSNRNYTFGQYIDSIFKLKSPLKVKPKNQLFSTKNKKRSQEKVNLDKFSWYKLFRFEYKEKNTKKKRIGQKIRSKKSFKNKKQKVE